MANLITLKQKANIKSEYNIRLVSISLALLALLGLFLLAYVVPYYLSITKKDLLVAEQFTKAISAENRENTGESVLSKVNRTLQEMKIANSLTAKNIIPSDYILKIIEAKNDGIKINSLSFFLVNSSNGQFVVSGVALARDNLVSFIEVLKNTKGFTSVESPVSNFAKESNIAFSINIKSEI